MSVFAAIVDFALPPIAQEAETLLSGMADNYFEASRTSQDAAMAVAVKIQRITPESVTEVQPFRRHGITLVADCRLDNRAELLQQLASHSDSILSDIDLLFLGYQRWGPLLPAKLRGDFSVVIWDNATGRLTAFVDQVSAKRLFYRQVGSRFYLSNQLVRVRRPVAAPITISPEWAANYIVRSGHLMFCPRQITLFEQIKQLEWGQCLTLSSGGLSLHSYQPMTQFSQIVCKPAVYPELIAEAQRLFIQATKRRMRSINKVACHLSGGLDSSSTAVTALSLLPASVSLDCYHYEPNRQINDAKNATRVNQERLRVNSLLAHYPAMQLHKFSGGNWSLARCLQLNMDYADMPLVNAVNHTWFHQIAEFAANSQQQVILTGAAGNFTLSQANNLVHSSVLEDILDWQRQKRGPQPKHSRLNQAFIRQHLKAQLYRDAGFGRNFRRQRLQAGFMGAKGLDLDAVYKNAFGVEHWHPVTDFDFASFVWSLPADIFSNTSGKRQLVYQMMADQMPAAMFAQKIRGVQSADAFAWYLDELPAIQQFYASGSTRQHQLDQIIDHRQLADFLQLPVPTQQQNDDRLVSVLGCYHLDRLAEFIKASAVAPSVIPGANT